MKFFAASYQCQPLLWSGEEEDLIFLCLITFAIIWKI